MSKIIFLLFSLFYSCYDINIFKRFAKLGGNKKTNRVHPRSLDRYNALVRWCK